jgi:hypothetical protein
MKQTLSFLLLGLSAATLSAHECWLQPATFTPIPGPTVGLTIQVGMNFEGEPRPFSPDRIAALKCFAAGGTEDWTNKANNLLQLPVRFAAAGTQVVVYDSKPSLITLEPARQLRAITEVATAVDSTGMIGGQVADIVAERSHETPNDPAALLEELHFIHRNKTGKLFTVSVILGGLLGGATEEQLAALRRYGDALGLAFQIVDDLLDNEESSAALGKTAGKDVAQGKLTFPALLGIERARQEVERQLGIALENADKIAGPVNYLAPIARYICERRT